MSEPINLGKFAKSFIEPLAWFKSIAILVKMVAIVGFFGFVGYGVYKAYFKKPDPSQEQRIEHIEVQRGGRLILQEQSKKRGLETFVEVFMQIDTDGDMGPGIRGGVRF